MRSLSPSGLCLLLLFFFTPFLQAQFQWEYTGGAPGVFWTSLSERDDQYLYQFNEYAIFRTDGGECWERIDSDIYPIHGSNGVLFGVRNPYDDFRRLGEPQLFISTDHAETWTEINSPTTIPLYFFPGRVFATAGALYVVDTDARIAWKSVDEGDSWQGIEFPPAPEFASFRTQLIDDVFYLYRGEELLVANEDGTGWEVVEWLPEQEYISIWELYLDEDVFMISSFDKLWLSHDEGASWTFIDAGNAPYEDFARKGDRIYAVHRSELAYTEDFGLTWQEPFADDNDFGVSGMAVVGDQVLVSNPAFGLLLMDEETETFSYSYCGIGMNFGPLAASATDLWTVGISGPHPYNFATQEWNENAVNPQEFVEFGFLAASEEGKVVLAQKYITPRYYYSEDSGNTWTILEKPESSYSTAQLFFQDEILFAAAASSGPFPDGNNLYRYEDGQWVPLGYFAVFPGSTQNSRSFVELGDALVGRQDGYWVRSTDLGDSWEQLSPVTFYGGVIASGDVILNVGSTKIEASLDGGSTWFYASDGLLQSFSGLEGVGGIHQVDSIFVLDYDNGFYGSLDSCRTWLPIERRIHFYSYLVDTTFYRASRTHGVVASGPPNVYGNIYRGSVFWDKNGNGTYEPGEDQGLRQMKVGAYSGDPFDHFFTRTDLTGRYSIGLRTDIGDSLRATLPTEYAYESEPLYYLIDDTGNEQADFAITFDEAVTDLAIGGYLYPNARPGFDARITLMHRNLGTTEPNARVALKLDERINYLSASPEPSLVAGDSLIWDVGRVPLFSYTPIQLEINIPTTVELGDTLRSAVYSFPEETDVMPADNQALILEEVVGSYDPNDKQVFPTDGLSAEEIENGKALEFLIRFQNTGTFYAERVRITDQLDTALNWTTLKFLAASHDVTSWELKPGGLLEVVFDQIFLPDSTTNEPESHGFVRFSIERNKHYRENHLVRNKALIYFDFNDPIITNEVSFRVADPRDPVAVWEPLEVEKEQLLHIFPNPASDLVWLEPTVELGSTASLEVFDAKGMRCFQSDLVIRNGKAAVDFGQLPAGTYLLQLKGKKALQLGKLILLPD